MKTIRTIIVCTAAVSCVFALYGYRWKILTLLVGEYYPTRLQLYTSPNEGYVATLYFKRDRAEGNFRSFLNLSTGGESFKHEDRIITLFASTAIECKWKNEHLLVIKYYGDEDIDDGPPLSQWRDIKIEYIKLVDPNETASWATGAADANVMGVGMDYDKTRAMLDGLRAEEISLKVKLPHAYVPPSERYNSYRLKSGTVIEIYGRPHYAGFALYRIIVSSDKLEPWTGEAPPEIQNKEPDLHLIGVKEFDLKKDAPNSGNQ